MALNIMRSSTKSSAVKSARKMKKVVYTACGLRLETAAFTGSRS